MLNGKVALVTGASKGIGAGIATVLASYGADVAVNYNTDESGAVKTIKAIESLGRKALLIQADVIQPDSVAAMVEAVTANLGMVDILVNNAGHNPLKSIMDIEEDHWDWMLDLNLKSYYRCTKAVLPSMIDRGGGRIINITSISGQRGGLSCDVDYSAAKAGIMGFTRALARWAAPQGILVNAIAPGYIDTSGLHGIAANERVQQLIDTVPLGRLGTPEEMGEVVAMLAGPAGTYMVGEVLTVNGGVHIT